MVKDPDTGRRVSRPNPESEWQIVSVPELAIITEDVFLAAQQRKLAHAHQLPTHQRRPRHVLSGLLRCAACGSGMSAYGGKAGRTRIRCTAANESGTCPDPVTFELGAVESVVFSGLRTELQHPDLIAEYVRTYHAERKRLAADNSARREKAQRRREEVTKEIERVVDAIAKGIGDLNILGPRTFALRAERDALDHELAEESAPIIALHPGALARYEEQVGRLQETIRTGIKAGQTEAAQIIRELIESVTVRRRPDGLEVEIKGRLNALLGEDAFPNGVRAVCGTLVAEECFNPSHTSTHFSLRVSHDSRSG
jgi:hypothetical protein